MPLYEPATDPQALPPRTTPTWEMELLLSGATVFALLQAYAWLAPNAIELARLAGLRVEPLLGPLLLYLQAGVLALAGGFVLHLLLRALWIALVGLRSVDPAGSMRNAPNLGPWSRERISAAWDAMPAHIAALDDRATVVFAASLGVARLMGQLFLVAAAMVLVALLINALSLGRVPTTAAFLVLGIALMLPYVAANAADHRAGRRGSAIPGWANWLLSVYDRFGMTAQHNLGVQFLVHRLAGGSRVRGVMAMMAILFVLTVTTALLPLALRGELSDIVRAGFPSFTIGDHTTVRGMHYGDTAAGAAARRLPSIPSMQVRGAWLPLLIPWVDVWHANAFEDCTAPHGRRWRTDRKASLAVMDCMAALQPVTLDGVVLATPWVLIDDPRRDRRGFLVMIDLRDVPSGAHELTVMPTPPARNADAPDNPWRILFWN